MTTAVKTSVKTPVSKSTKGKAKAKPEAKKPEAEGRGPSETHVKVLRMVKQLGGQMVQGPEIEKRGAKSKLTMPQVRRALYWLWQNGMVSFIKSDPDKPRSDDVFSLTAKAKPVLA